MANIWKATYRCVVNGRESLTGFHYQFNGDTGSDEPDAHSVADKLDAHLSTALQACVISGNYLESLAVRQELAPGSSDVPDEYVKNLHLSGTLSGAASGTSPAELCALVHRRASAPVRGAKSWCFMPPTDTGNNIAGDRWVTGSGAYPNWAAFAALLDDVLNYGGPIPGVMGDLNPVAYSRTRRLRSQTPYTFQITSADVDTRPRWLRSRAI
jgi:hypothetical protein